LYSAIYCRLCETPLKANPQQVDSLSPTLRQLDKSLKEDEMESIQTDGVACPSCGTMNEMGWAFCQHCGSKLPQMAAPPSPPKPVSEPVHHAEQPTVVAHQPIRDFQIPIGQQTVAEQPPQRPQPGSLATVADQPPVPLVQPPQPDPRSLATVVDQPHMKPIAPEPQIPSDKLPSAPPPAPPQREPSYNLGQVTVPDGPPPNLPPPAQNNYAPPIGAEQGAKPGAGLPCQQCGHINPLGGAFCSACGNSLGVAKTLVMTSRPPEPPPAVGKLHLIMEGGQPGDVYDLKDQTIIGRVNCDISFPHDGFMSGKHASIERRGEKFILKDEGSRNGSFIRIKGEVELQPGDMVLIGKQLFRFEV
jgi:hypothetical protein